MSYHKAGIIFIYNSFNDPLFKGNLFQIILKESQKRKFKFIIITFEQKQYQINRSEQLEIKKSLLQLDIIWIPLQWHSGRFILLKKLLDGIVACFTLFKVHLKLKPKFIISLGTISGSFAYFIKMLFGYKHFAYQHEPHSEFMLDFGIWKKRSFSFKLLNFLEQRITKKAEIISTGTDFMLNRLKNEESKAILYKLPSCVNEEIFEINDVKRTNVRKQLGLSEKNNVFVYVGKFGGIYYKEETFNVISELNKSIDNFFIIILSPNDKAWIIEMLQSRNITNYYVNNVAYHEVSDYLNAADMGISSIPGLVSQKFRSPIKVGEYLMCGLPFITNAGVSEDDIIAKKYNVGVVLNEFSRKEVIKNMNKINSLLKSTSAYYLRKVGINYRGLSAYQNVASEIFEKL